MKIPEDVIVLLTTGRINLPVDGKGKYIQHQPLVHCSKASYEYTYVYMEFAV